jgi:hypothetical protein
LIIALQLLVDSSDCFNDDKKTDDDENKLQ